MPSRGRWDPVVLVAVAVVAILALLYALLIAQEVLVWIGIAVPLVALYLFWRLVRAHERLADAFQ